MARRKTIYRNTMSQFSRSPLIAVLGPTNTGKTHLAVERMAAHSSGIMGFPLRLLAREVYDRMVALKGPGEVALLTGEEKILPPKARWFLCTAESMPGDRDAAFVAIDEAQLGADPERGHVFTDRLLRMRGREETMILGSDALRPMLAALAPEAEIIGRPRFSTLSYAGARKLSRLPKRSAIVAFSTEEVYAVAEAIRRLRGGAAVVMGALSPRTRNAQVAMFQAGEVDYLVATDAIGMGLNMDVAHVAFAGLHKFDGRRRRRLTVAEMAQIAGRAGRHQRDGSFGALSEEGPGAFTPEEVYAIEGHRVPPLSHMYWREGEPDFASIEALVDSLERRPDHPALWAAPQAVDLAVLKRLTEESWVRDRVRSPAMVARLWAACGLPDFRKLGVDPHARFVGRVFRHLSEGSGVIAHQWFADEIQRLDRLDGDVETLAGRIAAVRSWAYIAHRRDWLADPAHWADRTRNIEERLSDALHASLQQRFVDKRTTVLLRQIGADPRQLPVTIGDRGEVQVEGHELGRLEGFRFVVASDARAADKRMLLAAAERRLGSELTRRAEALAAAGDERFALSPDDATGGPTVKWDAVTVARLEAGTALSRPRLRLDRSLDSIEQRHRDAVSVRIAGWLAAQLARHMPLLAAVDAMASDASASGAVRAVAAALRDAGGAVPRDAVRDAVDALTPEDRRLLRRAGVTIGTLDLFDPRMLKPGAQKLRATLIAARDGRAMAPPPPVGATVLPATPARFGYRSCGAEAVRIDLAERIARAAHDARAGRRPFAPDPALATSIGLGAEGLARLMADLGFRRDADADGASRWAWRGRRTARDKDAASSRVAVPRPGNPFAALREMARDNG